MGAQTGGQSQHQGCFPEEAAAWRLEQEEGRKASPGWRAVRQRPRLPCPGRQTQLLSQGEGAACCYL